MSYENEDTQSRLNRMHSALDARLQEVSGERADLYISDVLPLDPSTCYAMINYGAGLPPVTTANLVDFIGRSFDGKVRPVLETAKHYPDHNAVAVMLATYQPTRPLSDCATMHAVVAGARYLDVEMRDTWDVAVNPEGVKFLRRTADDDVSKMVADRKQRIAQAGVKQFALANALGAGVTMADTGDTIRCYWQGSVYSDCTVKNVLDAGRLTVQIPSVGNVTVAREAVVEIQASAKKNMGQMKSKLAEYYKKALPDKKYASELTKELVDEGKDDSMPSYWTKPSSSK